MLEEHAKVYALIAFRIGSCVSMYNKAMLIGPTAQNYEFLVNEIKEELKRLNTDMSYAARNFDKPTASILERQVHKIKMSIKRMPAPAYEPPVPRGFQNDYGVSWR